MESLRYVAAYFVVVIVPPLYLSWLFIHPLAAIWRKLGCLTYFFVWFFCAFSIYTLHSIHKNLLSTDYGTNYILVALSVLSFALAVVMAVYYKKHLTIKILIGLPELTQDEYPGILLTDGIYSRMRHPRYVGSFFFLLGCAFLANFLGPYIVVFSLIPVIYLIVFFEERELNKRFGSEYKKYCQKVPRFIPKGFL